MSVKCPPEINFDYAIKNQLCELNCRDLTKVAKQEGKSVTIVANGATKTYNVSAKVVARNHFEWNLTPSSIEEFYVGVEHFTLVEKIKTRLNNSFELIDLIQRQEVTQLTAMFMRGVNLDVFYPLERHRTPLMIAVDKGDHESASDLLMNGASADIEQMQGRHTPLHLAAHQGDSKMVKLLLEYHANPSASDKKKRTPLQIAMDQGHSDVVQILQAKLEEKSKVAVISDTQVTEENTGVDVNEQWENIELITPSDSGGIFVQEDEQEAKKTVKFDHPLYDDKEIFEIEQ